MLPREKRPTGSATASSTPAAGVGRLRIRRWKQMQSISVMRDYLWLRAMDVICGLRGHSVASFPKGRFCRRCYRVEGVDFLSQPQQPTSAIERLVRGRKE